MTDFEDHPKPKPDDGGGDGDRPVPTRVRRLSYRGREVDARADYVVPLATLAAVVAVLGLTCAPISTALWYAAARDAAATAATAATATTAATTNPAAPTLPPGGPGPVALALVGVFVGVALLGIVGGIATILYRNWGRLLLVAYAGVVLAYLAGVVFYRLSLGVEGVTQTAPTTSALILFFTCTGGVLLTVGGLMVVVIRYFTRRDVAARFG